MSRIKLTVLKIWPLVKNIRTSKYLPSTYNNLLMSYLVVLLISFLVYMNSLSNGFVYDDLEQVLENEWIKDFRNIPEIFSKDVWGFKGGGSNYYRPLMHLMYMANYHIFGMKPWGFHLVNILFHCGVSILVFIIAYQLVVCAASDHKIYIPSIIAAMLYATHPIHTEVVTWVASWPELSFTIFYLFSFFLYIKATSEDTISTALYLTSVFSYILSVFSKEPAVTLLLILIIYDGTMRKNSSIEYFKKQFKYYIPYLLSTILYFTVRYYAVEGFAPMQRHQGLTGFQYAINVFPLFIKYLWKLLFPTSLNVFHEFHPVTSILEWKSIYSILFTVLFIFLYFVSYRRSKRTFFSLTFLVVPLLPALYIPALGQNTFAERYLYLPSVGFVFLAGIFLDWAGKKIPVESKGIYILSFIVILAFSYGTWVRNTIWNNDFTLWQDTLSKSPNETIPHTEMGDAFFAKGLVDPAIREYRIALKLGSNSAWVYNNLGLAYRDKGWLDLAIQQFQMAIQLNPRQVEIYYNLAYTYSQIGSTDKAIEQYEFALRLRPKDAAVHNNLGILYGQKGQIDKAIEYFQAASKLTTDDPDIHYNLYKTYALKGWTEKAQEQKRIADQLKNRPK